jgi:heavy metal translocating P-type ATPase
MRLTDRLLHYDDIIRIKTGEIVPTDGVVVEGHGTVDESSLTGESVPVAKSPGSNLTAGTKLQDGQLDIAVTRLIPENSISTIVDAVSSSSTGSEYQDLADRMAGWLLPIAGVCCLAAFIGWMLVERLRRGQSWGEAVISGVGYAIAIAAVSCPCALAIAVSHHAFSNIHTDSQVTLVTSVSMATTVQDGILFRSTQALLTAQAVKAIAFDKTGTLSQGIMTVQQASYDQDPQSIQLIHAITAASQHPVSETAKRYIESQHQLSQETKGVEDIDIIPGKGVTATFFGFPLMAGNAEFTDTAQHPLIKEYVSKGMTILVITLGGQLIGLFGMKDQPRSGVNEMVTYLGGQGKHVSLVSGDNYSAVHSFAQTVGISHSNVNASQTPASKGEVVQRLKDDTSGLVAFVGDGINDTIALSTADISIATGSASNASSQIIILSSDVPKAVYQILATSRMTRNHVVVSLSFCGVYFVAAILLASGVTGWRIPPAFAGLGELVSILPVLLMAGHLASFKSVQRWYEGQAGGEIFGERD